jgi:beta-lactamase superfamily II metal-dependent hydrolase
MKKLTALAAFVVLLLTQRPDAQTGAARIYFVDVGTGASTLVVSPTGKTLLVDGGPPGSGVKIGHLLAELGITTIDYTVLTHYHIDHMGGLIEVLNGGRVAGVAFDNGDGADVAPPGTSTSPISTRGTYLNYVAATTLGGARQTAVAGEFIDLGGGMRATFVAAGARLLSGGRVDMTTEDLNSESVSTLIEYNNFDFLVSGDLTGGGSTSTAKTPDVETYVGQMVDDLDVVQLDHHGSTTSNNQTFLKALKAEVAFAQTGETNTFGHPHREIVNKYLNTPDTTGDSYAGTAVPPAGTGPVFYQNEASPAGDDRVTQQGYTGAAAGNAGQGTVALTTDGTSTYSLHSFDDGGLRLNPILHTYAVDAVSPGVTSDFKPTVIVQTAPVLPLAGDAVVVSAMVNDRESAVSSVTLSYSVNGAPQAPIAMISAGARYQGTIPAQPDGVRVDYAVTAIAGGQTTTFGLGYFAGVTPIASLRELNAKGEPLYVGYAARALGLVTASGFSGSSTNDDYVQDATGAINVYRTTDTPTPFVAVTPGQTVEARGRVGFNGGRLRLDIMESIEKTTSPYGVAIVSSGPVPLPVTTTIAAITGNAEAFEGQFVSIDNVSIVSGTIPATPQSIDQFVTISDGTGTFSLKIDDDADLEGFTPAATFTAAGIIQQDDFLRPFDAGYNITPRSRVDIGATPPPPVPLLTIADARVDAVNNATSAPGADFIPDRVGQTVKVRGAVTSIDFRGGTGVEYYVQDATGGIDLFSTALSPSFAIGDNVEGVGIVTHFNGLTELTLSAMGPTGGATTTTAPEVVTLAQLADNGAGEAFEGRLVRVNNVTMTSATFGPAGASNNFTITDATATGTLRVDSDTNIDGTPAPGGFLSVIGVVGQFDGTAPFDSGYQLLPRFTEDIEGSGCSAVTIAGTLGGGIVNTGYSQALTASGDTGPYTFSVASGTLPAGLTLSAGGVLAGTPVTGGTFTFTVRAVTAGGCFGLAPHSVTIINPAPMLSASPAAVAFGSVTIGGSAAAPVTMTNTGNAPLILNTPSIVSGADASQFQAAAPGVLTLEPGASTTATVTFVPTTSGAKSATLTITSNGGTAAIALTGTGGGTPTGGGIVISEFRTRGSVGGNDEFVEIYNNSDGPIDISGYRLAGSNSGGTTSTRATVPAGVVLPAHAHYLFVNTTSGTGYSLSVPGNRGFGTGITDDGGIAILPPTGTTPIDAVGMTNGSAYKEGSVLTTQLTSNTNRSYERKPGGLAPTLQDTGDNAADFQLLNGVSPNVPNPQNVVLIASPTSADFGGAMPPATVSQTVTVKNLLIAGVTLNLPAVIGGSDAASFSVVSPASATLAGTGTASILATAAFNVTFQPSTAGVKRALLSIGSSNAGSVGVALSGTGLPGISVSPTSIDFGSAEPGSTVDHTVTITNGNPTDVTLTPPFAITGPDAAAFTVAAPAASIIPGGGDTTTIVGFQPTTLGSKSATLTITSTNGGTRTIPLSGLAVDTTAPVLSLPENMIREAQGATTVVNFVVSATDSVDPSPVVACTPASGFAFPLGMTTVNCSATDAAGNSAPGQFTVTVRDTTPPAISPVSATPAVLWPPNHALVPVTITAAASDIADPLASCAIASVASSEAIDGLGDGDTAPDWTVWSGLTVKLRAERGGGGIGRIYTIGVRCSDQAGNTSNATQTVIVPHDRGK